jgi:hypothetical protein
MKYDIATEDGFYLTIGELLGCETKYQPSPYYKKTRWNNRTAGNGCYEGRGIVRRFSSENIHVQLRIPKLTGTYKTPESAITAIKESLNKPPQEII